MKYIYLNLKRFDIPAALGGVNSLAPVQNWAAAIVGGTREGLKKYASQAEFAMFLPEAHILPAVAALQESPALVGCQGLHREDVAKGGNFGAFTSLRTGLAMKALGAEAVIIGHCEERREKAALLAEAGVAPAAAATAVNRVLGQEVKKALAAGLMVLYCVGESAEQQQEWQNVLLEQLSLGLEGLAPEALARIRIAYEPVWAIGPGKTPPDAPYIQKIARFIKEKTQGLPVVYGGGLKTDNAPMLAGIAEVDGGLIALTRFSGEIGFYPEEYLEIIAQYLNK